MIFKYTLIGGDRRAGSSGDAELHHGVWPPVDGSDDDWITIPTAGAAILEFLPPGGRRIKVEISEWGSIEVLAEGEA